MSSLDQLYTKAIPFVRDKKSTGQNISFQLPAVAASAEPLVDLADFGIRCDSYYGRTDGHNPPYRRAFASASATVRCRAGVAARLRTANESLGQLGLGLLVLDGYRPPALQHELWRFFLDVARNRLGTDDPGKAADIAMRYCSNPNRIDPGDMTTVPSHSTGGAIDVTLCRAATGEPIFMGSIFDDPAEASHVDFFEQPHAALEKAFEFSFMEARRNRRLLYWTMLEAGFSNYPFEWWHYDFGNYAWLKNAACRVTHLEGDTVTLYDAVP